MDKLTVHGTIKENWEQFERVVLDPSGAGPIQRREMRRAFYAGFSTALDIGIHILGADGMSEDDGVKMLDRLHEELRQFADLMKMGAA